MGRGKQKDKGFSAGNLTVESGSAKNAVQDRQSSQAEALGTVLAQTIAHFFPKLQQWMSQLRDPRNPIRIYYPARFLLITGILMFILKLKSRRKIRFEFAAPTMLCNINTIVNTASKFIEHPDTLNYYMSGLYSTELPKLLRLMILRLIRMKCLENYRFKGCFLVAIDGTGIMSFPQRHCESCLTKKHESVTIYYHTVLEAKLVTSNGLALSLETEFIENPKYGGEKQDCELAAFYRLAAKLRAAFPQLSICLLMDSLYACQPVLKICKDNKWRYVISFKEGSMPERYKEYQALKAIALENRLTIKTKQGDIQEFAWINGLDIGLQKTNVLECKQTYVSGECKLFVWLTDFHLDSQTAADVANHAGRLRWKIENEGFNEQKNGGYELEHCYSQDWDTAKNYYYLLQIAHLIDQLVAKGDLIKKQIGKNINKAFGGIRHFARYLWESLRNNLIPANAIMQKHVSRIQIRFDVHSS